MDPRELLEREGTCTSRRSIAMAILSRETSMPMKGSGLLSLMAGVLRLRALGPGGPATCHDKERRMDRDLRRILAAVFLFFFTQTTVQVVVPIAGSIAGLAGPAIGLLIALPGAAGLLIDIPLSAVSDAIGRKLPVLIGAIVGLIGALALARASDLPSFMVGTALWAVAGSLIQFPAFAYITEAAPAAQHARIQGYNGAVQRVAFMVATISIGVLLTQERGSLLTFVVAAGCVSLIGGLAVGLKEDHPARARTSAAKILLSYRRSVGLLRRPAMLLSALIALTNGAVVTVVGNSFMPLYLIHDLHQAPILVGALLAWRNLVAASLSYFFGRIAGRVGVIRLAISTSAVAAASVLLIPVSTFGPYLFVVLGLQGIGYAFSAGTGNMLIASATSRDERALAFATNYLIARAGTFVLPLILGWLLELEGPAAVFYAAAAAVLANVVWMASVAAAVRATEGSSIGSSVPG